jgi:nitrite reductase (cytochrome c-552)
MPYKREGAVKITDHWIKSPLADISGTCLVCHRQSEDELRSRVIQIQDRTQSLMSKSEKAILAAVDVIKAAKSAGATDVELKQARALQRKAQIRWDFISAESSMGFHSGQEAARVLADSIDYARQAELTAYKVLTKKR